MRCETLLGVGLDFAVTLVEKDPDAELRVELRLLVEQVIDELDRQLPKITAHAIGTSNPFLCMLVSAVPTSNHRVGSRVSLNIPPPEEPRRPLYGPARTLPSRPLAHISPAGGCSPNIPQIRLLKRTKNLLQFLAVLALSSIG